MVHTIYSGGQTGADKTGLQCGRVLGLKTGGMAPKGYRVDGGHDLELRDIYGLQESSHSTYPPRTEWNVAHSDATVWFGSPLSPGGKLTSRLCKVYDKPFYVNPTRESMTTIMTMYEILNVAGNRAKNNPGVIAQVKDAFGVEHV